MHQVYNYGASSMITKRLECSSPRMHFASIEKYVISTTDLGSIGLLRLDARQFQYVRQNHAKVIQREDGLPSTPLS